MTKGPFYLLHSDIYVCTHIYFFLALFYWLGLQYSVEVQVVRMEILVLFLSSEEVFSLSSLTAMLGFALISYQLRKFPSVSKFVESFCYVRVSNFVKCLSARIEVIIRFFSIILLMW